MCVYIYIHTHVYTCMSIYIYIIKDEDWKTKNGDVCVEQALEQECACHQYVISCTSHSVLFVLEHQSRSNVRSCKKKHQNPRRSRKIKLYQCIERGPGCDSDSILLWFIFSIPYPEWWSSRNQLMNILIRFTQSSTTTENLILIYWMGRIRVYKKSNLLWNS